MRNGGIFVMGSFVAACSARVARLPRPGESLLAEHFVLEPGGKGFNLIAGAHRLGPRVDGMRLDGLLAIGNDPFADFAVAAVDRLGLERGMLVRLDGATGAGIGFIDAEGENCLAVYPGVNARLGRREVLAAADRIAAARLVLAQFEIGDAAVECAFALAREAGATTLLNPSPWRPIRPEILANTSILVVNGVEAACLAEQCGVSGERLAELARVLIAQGLEALVVTLGAAGARLWRRDSEPVIQAAFPVRAVDTLGAGDAFIAAFAVGLVEGLDLAVCAQRGAAAGAHATTQPGVLDALPTRADLEMILAGRGA